MLSVMLSSWPLFSSSPCCWPSPPILVARSSDTPRLYQSTRL